MLKETFAGEMSQLIASSPNSSDDRRFVGGNGTLRSAGVNGTLRSVPSSVVTDTDRCIKNIRCNKLNPKLKSNKLVFVTEVREENKKVK